MNKTQRIFAELEQIRALGNGLLVPENVVEFAQNPATELHQRFEWDDTEAARKYRLDQARQIIRVTVTMDEAINEPVRAYVSVSTDRDGTGYRSFVDVKSDRQLFAQYLADVQKELQAVRRKYKHLREAAQAAGQIEQVDNLFDLISQAEATATVAA